MIRTSRGFITAVVAVTATVSAVATAPRVLHAQAATVTFNTLTESSPGSGTRYIANCYMESGFLFIAVGVPCGSAAGNDAFVAGSANSPIFGGGTTPSFLLNAAGATAIDVTRVGGGLFTLSSIQLAPFFEANTNVLFTAMGIAGTVTQTFMLAGTQAGFQTFTFGSNFGSLSSVRIAATNEFGEPYVKLDNFSAVALQQAVVPEPSTVLLSAAGLAALAMLRIRRRTHA